MRKSDFPKFICVYSLFVLRIIYDNLMHVCDFHTLLVCSTVCGLVIAVGHDLLLFSSSCKFCTYIYIAEIITILSPYSMTIYVIYTLRTNSLYSIHDYMYA